MSDEALVVYTGAREMSRQGSEGAKFLDDSSVLPLQLYPVVEAAELMVIADTLSFPFESLRKADWDVPLVVVLPDRTAEEIIDLLDELVLSELTPFDFVVSPAAEVTDALRERYRFAASNIGPADDLDDVIAIARRRMSDATIDPAQLVGSEYDPLSYWSERGEALASEDQSRAIMSIRHGLRANKAQHRVQAAALEPAVAEALESLPGANTIAEIGCGVGRWAYLAPNGVDYIGYDISAGMIDQATINHPEQQWWHLGPGLRLVTDPGTVDIFLSVTVLHHNPPEIRRQLIESMFESLRPGGRLVLLEDMVASSNPQATVFEMSLETLADEILEATSYRVVLEHLETVRYSHVELVRTGLIVLSKLGPA